MHTIEIPINNYLLYQLGISHDSVIDQTNVESIICKTLKTHKVEVNKVDIPSVVRVVIQKLKNMLHRLRKCKGGHSRKKVTAEWKKSDYIIKLPCKTDTPTKRKLKEDVARERKKLQKSVEKVKEAEHKIEQLLTENRELERQMENILHKKPSRRGKARNKLVYSKPYRRRMELCRIKAIKRSVQELSRGYFSPISLEVQDRLGRTVAINIENTRKQNRKQDAEQLIDRLIYIRDTQNISRRAHHELTMHCQTLPKEYRLHIRKQEINSQSQIHNVSNYIGVWQSFRETLCSRLSVLIRNSSSRDTILQDGVVKVKITGDGTTIGKRISVTNIAFSIIGENTCVGSSGSYLLAIVRVPEKQAALADALSPLITEINDTDKVFVLDESVKVQLYLGGDLKFLNQIMGIEGFSAKHCCLWCICPSELRWDFQKVWCVSDIERGARTVQNITENSLKRGWERLNCFSPPLFFQISLSSMWYLILSISF
ncbi:hypothetical protein HOLleu_42179 [Holothuria leucospilota]|uniref:Uncharacterized protein n=1 Tax=Holothuria leucospilota TaxID=206669 RepID=A0A9Q0YAT5_HOLLE|nr:hypothetical protein HOLleu_42179 [Holothuria leucospilota]